ncbi:MAG: hypothetical protein ACTHK0_20280 [Ginsengibacter sp.]
MFLTLIIDYLITIEMRIYFANKKVFFVAILAYFMLLAYEKIEAQNPDTKSEWIRPVNEKAPAVWGIHNGIVFGLWPYTIETGRDEMGGGPRGLIRVGYEMDGNTYLINFIAIEPVVNGKWEFSEISPSKVDGQWGKLMWTGTEENSGKYYPSAITPGIITHPDNSHPNIEELSVYVYMEQFLNGAYPYFKISIRDDRPEEIGFEIFNQKNSAQMERCALTATMGNYSRLRLLYLKDTIIDSRHLYKGFDGIDFIEKEGYPAGQLLKDKNGDFIVLAESNESFDELSSWPQTADYLARWSWRYRPFFKVTQYWRKESAKYDPSLHVRVNARVKYWSGGSGNKNNYLNIPGGPAFENFELREKYYRGQKFYFGISRKMPQDIISGNQ